ncbi:MAG: class I SAM-dependent methyltransferase, partial [Actinobacteria bacterium]|nr:class I SAM-dependent methyltransferase [Actinomycetota bacterium]
CFELEDQSIWFKHRNDCIALVISQYPPTGPILDVGGGNGFVAKRLIEEGNEVSLLEPGPVGAFNAKHQRNIPEVILSSLEQVDFPEGSINAIGCFDVIEHIKDDLSFVNKIHNLLKPKGMFYATLPAHQFLWSYHDICPSTHQRRYNKEIICKLLSKRFDLIFYSYIFKPLFLPTFIFRRIPYCINYHKQSKNLSEEFGHTAGGGLINNILKNLLKNELYKLKSGKKINLGTSCIFAAKKITI